MDLGLHRTVDVQGVQVPTMLYGTAWKEDATCGLVKDALAAGFLGIDTANQRKHYHEAEVGRALAEAGSGAFVQTKFTYRRGQDDRLPYDPSASLGEQVRQSFASSQQHLGRRVIDAYLLHGPELDQAWSAGDAEVWRAMEALHDQGLVRLIGVSNVRPVHLRGLLSIARVRPAFVQNRCYAKLGFDREVRELCGAAGIVYQGFSLLTANRDLWGHKALHPVARRLSATPAQVVLRYALSIGILPLTGTTDAAHMRQDLACPALALTPDEQALISSLAR